MNNNDSHTNKENQRIASAERMKEIQRIQYDYFKYFITLSSSGIALAFAFLERIVAQLSCWQRVLLFISLFLFFLVIIFSLQAMKAAGNAIQYLAAIQFDDIDESSAIKYESKFVKSLGIISFHDKLTMYFFIVGVFLLFSIVAFKLFF